MLTAFNIKIVFFRSKMSLYSSHVPLNSLTRLFLGVGSAATAIMDPKRGDMVAAMAEATAIPPVLENIRFSSKKFGL